MSEVLQIYIISMIDPANRTAEHICGHEERAGFASYEERMSANKRWVRARRVASCRVLSRPSLRHKRHSVSLSRLHLRRVASPFASRRVPLRPVASNYLCPVSLERESLAKVVPEASHPVQFGMIVDSEYTNGWRIRFELLE